SKDKSYSNAIMENESVSYLVAFTAGLLTYLSPCLLPLIPSFVLYITGISFADLKDAGKRGEVLKKTVAHSLLFILGFSLIFVLLGLTATFVGKLLFQYQKAIRIAGGVLIIILGLYLTGFLKIGFFMKERRLKLPIKNATYLGSFLVGVTFAAAWTPCAGPILGSILVLAGAKANVRHGAVLLSLYSIGIAIPFMITAVLANYFLEHFKKIEKYIKVINIVAGIFLVIIGILLVTGYLSVIAQRIMGAFTK
ncbi:MAG: cytochrome c biogenesis protein CcdA, partial [Candidatus Omnitrophica bacterium]|nr:cytochrome c biogenesis protein CcdA [Candidatus Omnitrophota bacterium]